ncbi:MAG: hypothetical protein J3R72DRAFT_500458 [Linnemannia gamsii]|nr:MAG: hypothetical protein J3R72DRAFT_500458 [Linnemannia gamsii]
MENTLVTTDNNYLPLEKKVQELTNNQGVHAVYDSIGQATFESSFSIVRRFSGTLVLYGVASDRIPPLDVFCLAEKNVRLTWTDFRHYLITREEFDELFNELVAFVEKGVKVSKVYTFEDVQQAHLDLEGRKTTGKLLFKIDLNAMARVARSVWMLRPSNIKKHFIRLASFALSSLPLSRKATNAAWTNTDRFTTHSQD